MTLLIPKTDKNTIAKIKAAIEASKTAYLQKHSGKKLPSALKTTLHDGDGERPNGGEFGPECKGHYVMTCSSNNKPVIVYADKTPITEASELYSGCYEMCIRDSSNAHYTIHENAVQQRSRRSFIKIIMDF